jgi:hypothetical protein
MIAQGRGRREEAMVQVLDRFKDEDFTLSLIQWSDMYTVECNHFQYGDNIVLYETEDKIMAKAMYEHFIDKLITDPPEELIHIPDGRSFQKYDSGVGRFWESFLQNFEKG